MASGSLIARIREGMEVRTSDGVRLGKINQVWVGSDPASSSERCDEDVCSRLEVRQRDQRLFIPYSAIADVSGRDVVLGVDAATVDEYSWHRPPLWITAENPLGPLGRTGPLHT